MHLMAKQVLEESKRLRLEGSKGDRDIVFDRVELEQPIGPYRADAIGIINDRQCIIEVAVTHRCSQDKIQYCHENGLSVVEVLLDPRREFESMDEFSEYVIAEASRRWLSNSVHKQKTLPGVMPIDHERIRELKEKRARFEPVFLEQLLAAARHRANKLHYGDLVEADLRGFGIPYQRFLCVKSQDLPVEYGNLAMVLWHHREVRKYLGRRVGFDIIYDYEQSIFRKTDTLFPQVVIRWVKDVAGSDLSDEIGTRQWRRKDYSYI